MHRLLWIIPLAIVALAIWAVFSLIPAAVLSFVGGITVVAVAAAAAVFLVMWVLATAMRS